MRGVRIVLGLKTQPGVATEHTAVDVSRRAIEKMAIIELQSRLRGAHVEHATRSWFVQRRRSHEASRRAMQDEVVVEAASDGKLRMGCPHRAPQQNSLPEIKRGPVNAGDLPGGNECPIDRCVVTGVNRQLVIEHARAGFAGEVEICVLRQIDDRRGVGDRVVAKLDRAGCNEQVAYRACKSAWIILLAGWARSRKRDTSAIRRRARRLMALVSRFLERAQPARRIIQALLHAR